MSDYEQNTLDQLADMNYKIKLEEISIRARPTIERDLKINDKFTKEMLENYGKLYNRPYEEYNEETGEVIQKKYQKPVEDTPELLHIDEFIDETDKKDYELVKENNDAIEELSHIITKFNEWFNKKKIDEEPFILKSKEDIKLLSDKYDSIEEEERQVKILSRQKTPKRGKGDKDEFKYIEALKVLKKEKDEIEKKIKKMNTEINDFDNDIVMIDGMKMNKYDADKKLYEEINVLKEEIKNEDEKQEAYDAIVNKVSQTNKLRISKHKDILNTLNSGAFNMEQAQGESEQEYLNRLNDQADTPYTENLLFGAVIDNIEKFKKNFKDITTNMSIIELVLNKLSSEEKFLVNKYWGNIRRRLLNAYGYNNKSVTDDDYYETINKLLSETENKPVQERKRENKPVQEEEGEIEIAENIAGDKNVEKKNIMIQQLGNVLKINNDSNDNEIYIKLGLLTTPKGTEKIILISLNDEEGTYNILLDPSSNVHIAENIRENVITFRKLEVLLEIPTKDILEQLFNIKEKRNFSNKAWDNLSNEFTLEAKTRPVSLKDKALSKNLIGWGINNIEIPKIVDFGDVKILLNKLYYKNLLVVKNKKGNAILGFLVQKVSDKFVENIMKMIKGEKITKNDINTLPLNEIELYDRLLIIAKLHKNHDNNVENTIKKIKERISIIEGEIEAGNNNLILLEELRVLLSKLVNFGVLDKKESIKHMTLITNDFF